MKVKKIVTEDFSNYKKISMFIGTSQCSWKCFPNEPTKCQNYPMSEVPTLDIPNINIINKYLSDPLTNAVVIGGLEPFDSFDDLYSFIDEFRKYSDDDIVIYSGYNEDQLLNRVAAISDYKNIIIKFGPYIPDNEPVFDEVLGVTLASSNQYAKVVGR